MYKRDYLIENNITSGYNDHFLIHDKYVAAQFSVSIDSHITPESDEAHEPTKAPIADTYGSPTKLCRHHDDVSSISQSINMQIIDV
mmetsp:Transcript_37056/g.52355  ORF Transcript_37056/g.52355 Transcript_37056/m.52355 type:complete len:86 (+) Transcript_37056:542-799(+)